MKPEVTRIKVFTMQVCVPKEWTDKQVIEFAEKENPCGTRAGWFIHTEPKPYVTRNPCEKRQGFVHIVLEM